MLIQFTALLPIAAGVFLNFTQNCGARSVPPKRGRSGGLIGDQRLRMGIDHRAQKRRTASGIADKGHYGKNILKV